MECEIESRSEDFARCALERCVANVRVLPFGGNRLVTRFVDRRVDYRSVRETACVEPWQLRISGYRRAGIARLLRVDGIELSVLCIRRIESNGAESARVPSISRGGRKLPKNFAEVDIGGEFLRGFVEDIQLAVLIDDEETRCRQWRVCRFG